jgi:glycosyltransferase involved in cell wall biosynthesis
MKIALLADRFYPAYRGGAERIAWELARQYAASAENTDVHVITCGDGKDYRENGMHVHVIPGTEYPIRWCNWLGCYNPFAVKKLKTVLHSIKPNVCHIHNVHRLLSWHTLKVCHDMGVRTVVTLHDFMSIECGKYVPGYDMTWIGHLKRNRFRYNPLRNSIIKYYLTYPDTVVAVSQRQAQLLMGLGVRVDQVIHNGIDVTRYNPDIEYRDFTERLGIKKGRKVFLLAGRISGLKGFNVAVEKARESNALLIVAGIDRKIGIENVMFTGWLDHNEMQKAYACCDLVLVPSQHIDPSPTVILEAQVMKKKWFASETVGDTATGSEITIKRCADEYRALFRPVFRP